LSGGAQSSEFLHVPPQSPVCGLQRIVGQSFDFPAESKAVFRSLLQYAPLLQSPLTQRNPSWHSESAAHPTRHAPLTGSHVRPCWQAAIGPGKHDPSPSHVPRPDSAAVLAQLCFEQYVFVPCRKPEQTARLLAPLQTRSLHGFVKPVAHGVRLPRGVSLTAEQVPT
jgi:hypothetical protein